MANPNSPFGLRPTRSIQYANLQINEYCHAAADNTALYIGDPIISNDQDTATSSNPPYPDGTPICTASGTITNTAIRGAVVGVRPTLTNLTLQYCPASVLLGILICDDPTQLFNIQSNGTVQAGDIGDTMGITSGSGSTVTGLSGYVATESTGHSDNANTLRVIRLAPITNNLLGANSVLEVLINLHELRTTTTS